MISSSMLMGFGVGRRGPAQFVLKLGFALSVLVPGIDVVCGQDYPNRTIRELIDKNIHSALTYPVRNLFVGQV